MREQAGGIRTDVPVPAAFQGGVNTASWWEYFEPVYPGDELRGSWRLIDIKPRETRLGYGIFITVEATIFKRTGELVAKNSNTHFRFTAEAGRAPRKDKPLEPPPEESADGSNAVQATPSDSIGAASFVRRRRGRRCGAAFRDVAELPAHRHERRRRSHVLGHSITIASKPGGAASAT